MSYKDLVVMYFDVFEYTVVMNWLHSVAEINKLRLIINCKHFVLLNYLVIT